MNYSSINDKLKEIKAEEFIWIIYIGIIILSFYSNKLEKNYLLNNDIDSKNKYRNTLILIFSILFFVYLYFLKDSYDSLKKCKNIDEKYKLNLLSFIASLLIFISGCIFLYIVYTDENLDVEIAFN